MCRKIACKRYVKRPLIGVSVIRQHVGAGVMSQDVNVRPASALFYPYIFNISAFSFCDVEDAFAGFVTVLCPALAGGGLFDLESDTVISLEIEGMIVCGAVVPTCPKTLCHDGLGDDRPKRVHQDWAAKSQLSGLFLD